MNNGDVSLIMIPIKNNIIVFVAILFIILVLQFCSQAFPAQSNDTIDMKQVPLSSDNEITRPLVVIQVGSSKPYKTIPAGIAAANDGDTIEIDAGLYVDNSSVISKNHITIRGVGGLAHMVATKDIPNDKGFLVQYGKNLTVENMEFSNAHGPSQNDAGIRSQGDNLTVRNCYFHDNENGILGGGATSDSNVLIEYCEFAYNGFGDGQTHNMYISNVGSFTLRYSNSHHAKIGHLVKSRAMNNYILYNSLMDYANGTASYEIDLPNGGLSYIIGNVIQQGPSTDNSGIISYGAEGLTNPVNELYVSGNTIVNDRSTCIFVYTKSGSTAKLVNNIFAGPGTVLSGPGTQITNLATITDPGFVNWSNFDFKLNSAATNAINQGSDPGIEHGYSLTPIYQYVQNANKEPRPVNGALDIGAYEYSPGVPEPPMIILPLYLTLVTLIILIRKKKPHDH